MKTRLILVFTLILTLLTACTAPVSATPRIHVENAWANPAFVGSMTDMTGTPDMQNMAGMDPGQTPTPEMSGTMDMSGGGTSTAVYFVIENDGGSQDTLLGATTDVAMSAEVHQTKIENNVAQMLPVSSLDVPANGRVEFKPGGYHVMLNGLMQDLKVGDTFKLNLQFKESGVVIVDVTVQQEH